MKRAEREPEAGLLNAELVGDEGKQRVRAEETADKKVLAEGRAEESES